MGMDERIGKGKKGSLFKREMTVTILAEFGKEASAGRHRTESRFFLAENSIARQRFGAKETFSASQLKIS